MQTSPKSLHIAIYVRTSKFEQNTDNQKIELIKYANLMGYSYDIYEEHETTRKTRPVKQKLMEMLRLKKYHGVMFWKLDRWGRSLTELVANLQELTDKGIKIICITDNIDYTSSSGQLFANMLACFAQYERSIISERTRLGLDRALEEGKTLGRRIGSKDKKPRNRFGYFKKRAPRKVKVNLPELVSKSQLELTADYAKEERK